MDLFQGAGAGPVAPEQATAKPPRPEAQRTRLSARTLIDDSSLSPGQRKLFGRRPQIPLRIERVRVPRGMRVLEVTVGAERFAPDPDAAETHASGVDFALPPEARCLRVEQDQPVDVLIESHVPAERCVPYLLGQPLAPAVSCVALVPIERVDVFNLGVGNVGFKTAPMLAGRFERLYFCTDDLHDLDLEDMRLNKDSLLTTAGEVPLGSFPEGLDVSFLVQPWHALRFVLHNRGARRAISFEADVTPLANPQE